MVASDFEQKHPRGQAHNAGQFRRTEQPKPILLMKGTVLDVQDSTIGFAYEVGSRQHTIESAKRYAVEAIWKAANIELPCAITFPETEEIYEGKLPEHGDVKKVVVLTTPHG